MYKDNGVVYVDRNSNPIQIIEGRSLFCCQAYSFRDPEVHDVIQTGSLTLLSSYLAFCAGRGRDSEKQVSDMHRTKIQALIVVVRMVLSTVPYQLCHTTHLDGDRTRGGP
jgi:hypothetical protein